MEKRIILGTAGHIDHGKTALVKAVTGVDTDRLIEEKRRGITIELGFTSVTVPSGIRLGIVDMPGHERFIDNMVAGASGIDMVLLVVAADEGVMPQTIEHLGICGFLGIRTGLVAMTKVDLVDEEMRALALDDIQGLIQGTFLENKPIVPFSAVTGEGQDMLLEELDRIALESSERRGQGEPRLPIDRVFTIKGFGTVVTGTLIDGKLVHGDRVEVLPSGHRARIRGIQVHNQTVEEGLAGSRTAVNLQGIDKAVIQRGEILARPDRFGPSYRIYARFQYQPQTDRALPNRFRLMVHWGTARLFGRIRFLSDMANLEPGNEEWVQIHLESPIFPVFGDRFIARDFSTNQTLGGGIIVDPRATKFKKKHEEALLPWLERLRDQEPEYRISYYLWKQGAREGTVEEMAAWAGLSGDEVRQICIRLAETKEITQVGQDQEAFVRTETFQSFMRNILEQVEEFHRDNPYQPGIQKEALGWKLREFGTEGLLGFALTSLSEQGKISHERNLVRLTSHRIELSGEDDALGSRILSSLEQKAAMPPTVKELSEQIPSPEPKVRTILDFLAGQGKLVKVSDDLYYPLPVLEGLKEKLVKYLRENGEIKAGDFKTLSQTTRKYTIPLMEYFDRTRLTLRLGDRRVLRDKK